MRRCSSAAAARSVDQVSVQSRFLMRDFGAPVLLTHLVHGL
jgi:hypothetical protein